MKEHERRGKADQKRRADFQKQIDADWRRLGLRGHACGEVSRGLVHGGLRRFEKCRLSLPDRSPNVRRFTFFQPRGFFLSAHPNFLEQDMCKPSARARDGRAAAEFYASPLSKR